ncbi:gp45.2 conserved hypothetical protein [Aeromonas phage PX29]|uniref:Uncharacterized protein 45.2 n=1 Tax=Aeromonas phage PX29 TaxID=926067 RepID=E5DPV5_9CAUD|nr:gp45.2 conserved hypothetical protein [Aeromonas phage PX29]ADQ52741.1 gp45.2 conserved hypothetical protein [Aeromonas phage PX29]
MFDNIDEVYPDVEFWVLSNKRFNQEIKLTYNQLLARFGEEHLARVINNFDPHWIAWKL